MLPNHRHNTLSIQAILKRLDCFVTFKLLPVSYIFQYDCLLSQLVILHAVEGSPSSMPSPKNLTNFMIAGGNGNTLTNITFYGSLPIEVPIALTTIRRNVGYE